MATFQQKYEALKKEFNELDINDDGQLDREEMLTVLDNKIGKTFDREVGEELWTHLDVNKDGKVTVNEFIQILIKAEDSLKGKIATCRNTLELNYQQKRDAESQLNQQERTEVLNNFGVMNGSQLCVILIEGANLKADQSNLDPYVTFQFDRFEKQSTISKGRNPVWDGQQFFFPVATGKEDLKIAVCDFDKYTNNIVIARVDVNLSNNSFGLKDQQLHDLWLDLYDINGNLSGSQIHIQIQWIYSKTRLLREVLNSYQKQVSAQEQELLEYERDLYIIYEPFMSWKQLNTKGAQLPQKKNNQASMMPVSYKQADPTKVMKPFSDPVLDKNSKFKLITILMGLIGCLTLLILFYKAQFFDIILLIDFYILWEFNALNENRIKTLGILFGLSSLFDLIWFFCVGLYWLTGGNNQILIPYEISIQQMIAILVVISLIFRIYLVLNLFQLSQDVQGQQVKQQSHNIVKIDVQNSNFESKTYLHNGRPIVIY